MRCSLLTGDEDHGGDDVGAVRIGVLHTKCWTQDERYSHYRADHRQVVLSLTNHQL